MSVNQRRPSPRLNRKPVDNDWYIFVLIFLFSCIWAYAWLIERVDPAVALNWINQTSPINFDSSALGLLLSFFHWKVLRHVLPLLVGWYFAYDAAVVLVKLLYDLPIREDARKFLGRLLGPSAALGAVPEILPATLSEERDSSVMLRVGGPGRVKIPAGHVMITELNGRFLRILPAGKHTLGRFEYIHAALNLQPQTRSNDQFTAYSRDGIELRAGLSLTYRIKMGDQVVTTENPFPYDETAVHTAAYAQTVLDDSGTVATWEDAPLNMATGTLIGILAGFKLDEIIAPERPSEEPFRTLNNKLKQKLRNSLNGMGIDLLAVNIERLDLPPGVNEQYIDYWKSHWQSQALVNLVDGTATAVEELKIARAEAEMTMIQAILEGVQRARREGATAQMDEIVALRLVDALEMMARQSEQISPLPQALLPQLDYLREQLAKGELPTDLLGESSS